MKTTKSKPDLKVVKIADRSNYIEVTSKETLEKCLEDPEFRDADEIMVMAYNKKHDYYNFSKSGELSSERKLWLITTWENAILRGDA